MAITGRYILNGLDMYSSYKFVPDRNCHQTFLQRREIKEPLSNDWAEQNGKDYDLSSVLKFKQRMFKMTGYISESNLANAIAKIDLLEANLTNTRPSVLATVTGSFNVLIERIDVENTNLINFQTKTLLKVVINLMEVNA